MTWASMPPRSLVFEVIGVDFDDGGRLRCVRSEIAQKESETNMAAMAFIVALSHGTGRGTSDCACNDTAFPYGCNEAGERYFASFFGASSSAFLLYSAASSDLPSFCIAVDMWRYASAFLLSNWREVAKDSEALPIFLHFIGDAALVVVVGVGGAKANGGIVVVNGFLEVADHHVRHGAVGIGRRVAIAGGDGIAVGADRLVIVAEFGVGEAFPQIRSRVIEGDVGGLLEIGDGHLLLTEIVEADASAEVRVAQLGIGFDGLREGADGIAVLTQHTLGKYGEAVRSFSQAIEANPELGDAYFRRGICFHNLGEEKMAISDFEQAAHITFDDPRCNLWEGFTYAKMGEYNQAIRAYGDAIAASDRYTPAYANRASPT